jgi:hypothetical protein
MHGGGDYSYNDLASVFNNKEAYIVLKDGSEFLGSEIRANGDSIFWTDPVSNKHYALAVNEVQLISRTNHIIGALEGVGFGLFGSAVVIAASAGAKMDVPGVVLVIIGAVTPPPLGLIIGTISGHSYKYNFPKDSTSTGSR